MTVRWPLVGRGADLERLRRARRRGDCVLALVVGPSGVGKTRLAEEFLAEATARGIATVRAAAVRETASVPFGAFLHLLTDSAAAPARPLDLLRQAANAFTAACRGRGAVLLVDDVPLLDAGSAALLHHLAVTRAAFVVATAREGEPLPDLVTALWRQGRVEELRLGPLELDQVTALLHEVLTPAADVDPGAAHRLWKRSGGNPLYLRELVTAALNQEVLTRDGGLWSLRAPPAVPAALERLVERRLADLPAAVRDAVELVAYAEPLRLEVLDRLVAAQTLEATEHAGLIRVVRDQHRIDVVVEHPLYGEVLRRAIPPLRARRLAGRLAPALAAAGRGGREDRLRLAMWQRDGLVDADPGTLLGGASEALRVFDHRLTAELAEAAAARGGGVPAEILAAESHVWLGESERAERRLARLHGGPLSEPERVRVAQARAVNLFFRMGRVEDARQVVHEALAMVGEPAATHLVLLEAAIVLRQGRPRAAIELVPAPVVDRPDHPARPGALPILVSAYAWTGRTREAIDLGEACLAGPDAAADPAPFLVDMARLSLVGGYLLHGDLRSAQELTDASYHQALDYGSDQLRANWAMTRGIVALHRGRLARAVADLREGAALLPRFTTLMGQTGIAYCRSELALARLWLGDAAAAEAELAAVAALPLDGCFVPSYELAAAWLLAARGRVADAVAGLEAAQDTGTRHGGRVQAARALHDVARLGEPQRVAGRLEGLAAELGGPLVRAYAGHARAAADKDGPALARAAEAFAALGCDLLAAEAYAEAVALLPEREAGHAREAVLRLRQLCDGARTPALHLVDAVPGLSARQREIARLAASGMANRAIADALGLSVRTVESHLRSTYQRLGVSSRAELRTALRAR